MSKEFFNNILMIDQFGQLHWGMKVSNQVLKKAIGTTPEFAFRNYYMNIKIYLYDEDTGSLIEDKRDYNVIKFESYWTDDGKKTPINRLFYTRDEDDYHGDAELQLYGGWFEI